MASLSAAVERVPAVKIGNLWLWLDAWLLRKEAEGWIFYRHRQPTGGGLGALIEFQKVLEPGVKQIEEVPEHAERRIFLGTDRGSEGPTGQNQTGEAVPVLSNFAIKSATGGMECKNPTPANSAGVGCESNGDVDPLNR